MTEHVLLYDLGLILVCGTLFVLGARLARAPSIVAYLAAGLVLGPLSGVLEVTEALDLISETGIALLLFLVGLELSFDKIRVVGGVALTAGVGQVALTLAGGFGLARWLGLPPLEAAFVATALTFSSTVVVVKLLDAKRELESLHGRISIGVLLVQDVLVILALTALVGLGPERAAGGESPSVAGGLLSAFGGMALLVGAAILASRHLLPRLFGWVSASLEAMFIWSLSWCFLFILAAELLHLSVELGAFLAGIALAQLPYNKELRRRVHPLMNFFVAVFFVTLGTRMDLGAAATYWREALALSLFVLLVKPAVMLWLVPRLGHSRETGFRTGLTLAQISEFSFLLMALGLEIGIVDEALLATVGLVGLVTISVSSYLIQYDRRIFRWARQRVAAEVPADVAPAAPTTEPALRAGHVIVVGMNALGRHLVRELRRRGARVLAVDTDPAKLRDLPCETLLGNIDDTDVLEEAGLARAKLVVSALQIEDTNALLAFRCRVRGVPCAIHAFDRSVLPELREIGADHLIASKYAGLRQIAAELRRKGLIGA